jgi:hypothetical protein
LKRGPDDPALSGVGGLVDFSAFVQRERLGRRLSRDFGHLKTGKQVVYPMHTQMQLLIDAAVVGARRVFDFEWLATDPIFEHLAGGAVPSIDTLYDDLRRFGPEELESLEALVAEQGLRLLRERRLERLTVDIDTTVMPLFGHQEGAVPGSNPRYHGRPSHHPILARIAETDTVFGARALCDHQHPPIRHPELARYQQPRCAAAAREECRCSGSRRRGTESLWRRLGASR